MNCNCTVTRLEPEALSSCVATLTGDKKCGGVVFKNDLGNARHSRLCKRDWETAHVLELWPRYSENDGSNLYYVGSVIGFSCPRNFSSLFTLDDNIVKIIEMSEMKGHRGHVSVGYCLAQVQSLVNKHGQKQDLLSRCNPRSTRIQILFGGVDVDTPKLCLRAKPRFFR